MERIVFVDSEVTKGKVKDLGAVKASGEELHSTSFTAFSSFIRGQKYVCGHNLINFDLKFIGDTIKMHNLIPIDTLYVSPLLFPKRPYHRLLKDDKLLSDQLNNPLNDSLKARDLFYDEVNAYYSLPKELQTIFSTLLSENEKFSGFFDYVKASNALKVETLIREYFEGKICSNIDIRALIHKYPTETAYALSAISCDDKNSIIPRWVQINYPVVDSVLKYLRNTPCKEGCSYCRNKLDVHAQLKHWFGFPNFRTYAGEPLQENAARAAVQGKSLLAIFPTGGGKSITFQLPALVAGNSVHGLTIVIVPLQSLMQDQVMNLDAKGIHDAVFINGLLSPIERKNALQRVEDGTANILYIAPESLRSNTIEKIISGRTIVRFVIDEAHCFSAWGQDFRVDYLYIADFIKRIQEKKNLSTPIPVSCFTATAKQKVVSDIKDYFKTKLNLDLELFTTNAQRENLHYTVLFQDDDDVKYTTLRGLIQSKKCPTIVYVSRVKQTERLSDRLNKDGISALPYNGQMESTDKVANQEAFKNNNVQVIVATSAFGMGIDKADVKLVVHFDISDSLENYVQEAGRAGRNPDLQADCYVLFNNDDLNKHFMLLHQSKITVADIQQIWKAIKEYTKYKSSFCASALEIARQAGWDDSIHDIETRVRTAISALETAGFVKRENNSPAVFATSILAKNMIDASAKINQSSLSDSEKVLASRILTRLFSAKKTLNTEDAAGESRVDYLADILGVEKNTIINVIDRLREIGVLSDDTDMSAYIYRSDNKTKCYNQLSRFSELEEFLISNLSEEGSSFVLKELNDAAIKAGIKKATVKDIRTILYYWTIKKLIRKTEFVYDEDGNTIEQKCKDIFPTKSLEELNKHRQKRYEISRFIINEIYRTNEKEKIIQNKEEVPVYFSLVGLYKAYKSIPSMDFFYSEVKLEDFEDALLYLAKIGVLRLEGGFLVSYTGMEIVRLQLSNQIKYKETDYKYLKEYYKQKERQINIVGQYAKMMVEDYDKALQFVQDYFHLEYKLFVNKYFDNEGAKQLDKNITSEKFDQLFGHLSTRQLEIINDEDSQYIVVAAGPGSGKTMVLVHKLASLLLMEDVKTDQLLMLTFSRASATEFKKRLIKLIGKPAHFVDIKTFHSYCFDLIGKIGTLDESSNVVQEAAEMIESGEVEPGKITKSVLVIDEAQDMGEDEFKLVQALISRNDSMRLIAVGDDDQNIFGWRGSSSNYMKQIIKDYSATEYDMVQNYRSTTSIVKMANYYSKQLTGRMKHEAIKPVSNMLGKVNIVKHLSNNMEGSIVEEIKQSQRQGSIAVITYTNDEALKVLGLLLDNQIPARLIQSLNSFRLLDLQEVRTFYNLVNQSSTPLIDETLWHRARISITQRFKDSSNLKIVQKMIDEFETVTPHKYKTDFYEFLIESKYEDFFENEEKAVVVSTIHRSKGREFDAVYLLLNQMDKNDEEKKREVYVGITRAKSELTIHYNNDILGYPPFLEKIDSKYYPEPKEIAIQFSHSDVVLVFFKSRLNVTPKLTAGMELQYKDGYLYANFKEEPYNYVKLSIQAMETIKEFEMKGYTISKAFIQYIVYWTDKEDNQEIPIILPEVHFERKER